MARKPKPNRAGGPSAQPGPAKHRPSQANDEPDGDAARPLWDASFRDLSFGGVVVKQFRRPAPWLEIIVAAFQEDGWPRRIDDPLPRENGVDSQHRLHDAIKGLNYCQSPQLIRFYGDGTGTGVCWERMKQ